VKHDLKLQAQSPHVDSVVSKALAPITPMAREIKAID